MSGLEGKIVLITGASTGIGAGAAKHFATLKGPYSLSFSSSWTEDPTDINSDTLRCIAYKTFTLAENLEREWSVFPPVSTLAGGSECRQLEQGGRSLQDCRSSGCPRLVQGPLRHQ